MPELVETLPDEVEDEVETLPMSISMLIPPEVEELPVPPDEVEVEPPLVEVDPPDVVELITTLPPLELPPPKKPPKKPPPKPPSMPPPITTGAEPPLVPV